jgi:kumamolisin
MAPKSLRLALFAAALTVTGVSPALAADQPSAETEVIVHLQHAPGLAKFVRAVSDPESPRYRQYRSVEQLTKRFGAKPAKRARTVRYLRGHGLQAKVAPGATFLLATGTSAQVAAAFPATGARAAAAGSRLAVPAALRGAVSSAAVLGSAVAADRRTPVARAASAADPYNGLSATQGSAVPHSGTASGCPEGAAAPNPNGQAGLTGFTPNQLSSAYGIDLLHQAGLRGQGMHVALVEIGGFNRGDIETFAKCFGITMPKLTTTSLSPEALPSSVETTLDIETLLGQLPELERMDVYEAAEPKQSLEGDLLEATAAALGSKGQRPDVISISYGICEPLQLGALGAVGTARALDTVMQLAAGAGISVTVSTGDDGYPACAKMVPATIPAVNIPSSLPHVTAVGGTNLTLDAANHIVRETAWNDTPLGNTDAGGGGRSLMFSRPWWQQAPGVDSPDRSTPDVSAQADPIPGYAIYCTSATCSLPGWQSVGGTSAASPLVAAGLTLLDQAARQARQQPVGFVNPLLYGMARGKAPGFVFTDVTIGNTDVGMGIPAAAGGGEPTGIWQAKKGYDMATGLGSIRFAALNQLALRSGGGR